MMPTTKDSRFNLKPEKMVQSQAETLKSRNKEEINEFLQKPNYNDLSLERDLKADKNSGFTKKRSIVGN